MSSEECSSIAQVFLEYIEQRHGGSDQLLSPFDLAIDTAEFIISKTDWTDDQDIRLMAAFGPTALLSSEPLGDFLPQIVIFLQRESQTFEPLRTFEHFSADLALLCGEARTKATEFIINIDVDDMAAISARFAHYQITDTIVSIVEFLAQPRYCCRMRLLAWLIPKAAEIEDLIGLISYAAVSMAQVMNDPVVPFQPHCTSVGSSWFHRLGVYLLHLCGTHKMAPPRYLVKLMALVAAPPSSSAKSGKAFRMLNEFEPAQYPAFLHESPPDVAVGTQLALELLGEFDANRQPEHFHRLERAVAYYAHETFITGKRTSARQIQVNSGMSWADAKQTMALPSFSRMVFNYQCRYIMATDHRDNCPQCREQAKRMKGLMATPR